ncbi:hypothetical protein FF1_037936 [Malus domestica]
MGEEDRRGESTGGGMGLASDDDDESDGAVTVEEVEVLRGSVGDTDGDGANAKAVSGGDVVCGEIQTKTIRMNPRSTQTTMRSCHHVLKREKVGRSGQQSETSSSFSSEAVAIDPGVSR